MDWERIRHGLGLAGAAVLIAAAVTAGLFAAYVLVVWLSWTTSGF